MSSVLPTIGSREDAAARLGNISSAGSQRTSSAEVRLLGPSPFRYAWAAERAAIIDSSASPVERDVYFSHEPFETWRSKRDREAYERGEIKRKPKSVMEENSGLAEKGMVAFVDFTETPNSIFVHYMNVRRDSQGQGMGRKLMEWIYAEAKRRHKGTVDWGRVVSDEAIRLFESFELRSDVRTEGHPERYGSLRTAVTKDVAYRGVTVPLSKFQGVPMLEAIVAGQTNLAHQLLIDAMAANATDKDRWWSAGGDAQDEAGRWWINRNETAWGYALSGGTDDDAWMEVPVVMTAEFEGDDWSHGESANHQTGVYIWHIDPGTPMKIVAFHAKLPWKQEAQDLLDAWRGVTSPGNYDPPRRHWSGTHMRLNIPPMRTTAGAAGPWYHWSYTGELHTSWIHAGTNAAAMERKKIVDESPGWMDGLERDPMLFELRLSGPMLNTPETAIADVMIMEGLQGSGPDIEVPWHWRSPEKWSEGWANRCSPEQIATSIPVIEALLAGRTGAIFYINDAEDRGSVSVVAPKSQWQIAHQTKTSATDGDRMLKDARLNYDLYRGFVPLVPEEFTGEATQENARKIVAWLGEQGLGMHWTPLLWVSEKWYRVAPPAATSGMAPVRVLITARPTARKVTDYWETDVERLVAGGVQEPDIGEIGGLVSYGWEQEHPIKAGAEMAISEVKISFPNLGDKTLVLRDTLRAQAATNFHASITIEAQSEGDTEQFKQYRLVYSTSYQGERKPRHLITAYDGDREVGKLEWNGSTGEVIEIEVERRTFADGQRDYRRQGIATAMWEWGQTMSPRPKHSKFRTDDGDAWAKTVNGPLPRRFQGAWRPATNLPRLYHGSPVQFAPGDVISSAAARGERSLSAGSGSSSTAAFATDSPTLAAVFARGGSVYEVRPVDADDVFVDLIDGYNEYASTSGFVVVDVVPAIHSESSTRPANDYEQGPFRKVIAWEPYDTNVYGEARLIERLECGHEGEIIKTKDYEKDVRQQEESGHLIKGLGPKTKRRCRGCSGELADIKSRRAEGSKADGKPEPTGWPGATWDWSTGEPVWTQSHEGLIADALSEWKGSASQLRTYIEFAEAGVDRSDSGNAKRWQAQARAMIEEMSANGKTAPKLYRGDHRDPTGISWLSWSESKSIARKWAKKSDGKIWVLPAGSRGMRISDYIRSGFDETEKEWIIADPTGLTTTAAAFDPRSIERWGQERPWERDSDLFDGRDGIVVGHARGSEAASFEGGKIVLKEEFFDLPHDTRKAILYHEAGHALRTDLASLTAAGADDPLDMVNWPGAQGLGYNYDEIIAEAYSAMWVEPEWFDRMGAHRVRDVVVRLASAQGFPLPSGVHTAVAWPESYISHDDRADITGYWYHGSPSKFPPGTILSGVGPRRGVPMWSETYANEPDRANYVWVTDSIDAAIYWAEKDGWIESEIHIYRVEPMDGPVRLYDKNSKSDGYVVPRARVVTEVEQFPRGLPVGEEDPFSNVASLKTSARPEATGDCYESAGRYMMDMGDVDAPGKYFLCHGVVTGQGPSVEGLRFGHAWCELVMDGGTLVIDNSNGVGYTGPKQEYYSVGHIKDSDVVRYDRTEMMKMLARNRHWGPWDPRFDKYAARIGETVYRGLTLDVAQPEAEAILAALNAGNMTKAAELIVRWAEGPQNGYNDGTGIGVWWTEHRNQIEDYYAKGGNLVYQNGVWSFVDRKARLGLLLEGALTESGTYAQTAGGSIVNLSAVNVWTYDEPYGRDSSWTHIPLRMQVRASGKPVAEMTKSEFDSKFFLYHGTNSRSDLQTLLAQGVKMSNVPMTLGRQRYQKGEYAEFQPGSGLGIGLYASGSPYTASQFGRHLVAIEVRDGDYIIPPESAGDGMRMEWALKDDNGVLIVKDIPADRVHLVVEDGQRYVTDAWADTHKTGSLDISQATLDNAHSSFIEVQRGSSLSGWKLHIYCEDTADVMMAMSRLRTVLDADPAMSCKVATKKFFELAKGTKQQGKGVTLYLPRVSTVEDDIDWVVRNMAGWPSRLSGPIQGDVACGNGVWKRYELSEPISSEIDISDMDEYHRMYVSASSPTMSASSFAKQSYPGPDPSRPTPSNAWLYPSGDVLPVDHHSGYEEAFASGWVRISFFKGQAVNVEADSRLTDQQIQAIRIMFLQGECTDLVLEGGTITGPNKTGWWQPLGPSDVDRLLLSFNARFGQTKTALRCTNAAFEALTGQQAPVEIRDGGELLETLGKVGFTYAHVDFQRNAPLRSVLADPALQQGSFYLFTSGHALAYVDGVLTDTEERGADGRRVLGVYRITRRSAAADISVTANERTVASSGALEIDASSWSAGWDPGAPYEDTYWYYSANLPERSLVGALRLRQRRSDGVWEIWDVAVDQEYRRTGIASAMLARARADLGRVDHAPVNQRTQDGLAWSEHVGASQDLRRTAAGPEDVIWFHGSDGAAGAIFRSGELWGGGDFGDGGYVTTDYTWAKEEGYEVIVVELNPKKPYYGGERASWKHPNFNGWLREQGHDVWFPEDGSGPDNPGTFAVILDSKSAVHQFRWPRSDEEDRGGVVMRKNAGLSLENVISVAEQAMERVGAAGKTIHMPGRIDDPDLVPIREWVQEVYRKATGEERYINIFSNDYTLRTEGGGAQAMITEMGGICTMPVTNEMTVLHEVAHLVTRTVEGTRGHTPEFAKVLHGLYASHLGEKAASVFWDIVEEFI